MGIRGCERAAAAAARVPPWPLRPFLVGDFLPPQVRGSPGEVAETQKGLPGTFAWGGGDAVPARGGKPQAPPPPAAHFRFRRRGARVWRGGVFMGKRRRFLAAAAALRVGSACPAQARFLRWTLSNIEGKNENNAGQVCPYCFQFLLPGNHRVRLKPKMRITPQIQKLLHLEAKKYKLSFKQGKVVKRYKESKNVLLITCNTCRKTTRHYGKSRECWSMKTSSFETPTRLNKTTPFTYSRSGSQRKKLSPGSRTSTPGHSTPHFSSGSPRNSKSKFTRLKKLLSLEVHKKTDKGDLKNFLSSL
uniref:UPF0711 protein C18orf21 homolog n=1 Tax=Euleptes europaea TaxID=460621 RepID=UPI00253FACD7|nr:UPF0711 protein C18orf21 homolog [Euleptes europaea]